MSIIRCRKNTNAVSFPLNPSKEKLLFFLFLGIGILVRIWNLNNVPGGINQDEAFGAYEAYSMLHYGTDSWGYRFPVYLTTWGSGMSALNAYLMMPFIAVFGLHTWVIRLPQAIVGCLTLCAVYGISKKILNETSALFVLFFTAIAPWHIMQSRWGLDCNLAPGFLMFGLYFFLRGLEHSRFLLLSALMYGLSLYCYATIWPVVPLIVGIQLLYGLFFRKIRFNRNLFLSGLLLGLLALPLLLFLLVNYGVIDEILLPFLSIPRMPYMRASEISFTNFLPNLRNLWYVLHEQTDGLIWNVVDSYGIYYKISFPFFLLGLFYCIKQTLQHWWKKEYSPGFFLLIQLGAALLLGSLIEVNINRINILFLPMIMIAATGICYLCRLLHRKLIIAAFAVYTLFFISFEWNYFTEYKETIGYYFRDGLEDALHAAEETEGDIYISSSISYPRILYYSQIPTTQYRDTVQVAGDPSIVTTVTAFGRYHFLFDTAALDRDAIYILDHDADLTPFIEAGFELTSYSHITLAVHPWSVSEN